MRFIWMLAAALFIAPVTQAQQKEPLAKASLIADAGKIEAGKPIWVALDLRITDGWHVYWRNPGDSGIPTEITWQLSGGMTASSIHWPVPKRHVMSGLANYGYSERVVLPVAITPAADAENLTLKAKASWLVCQDICIPESAELSIDLPSTDGAADIADALAQVPTLSSTTALNYAVEGDIAHITIARGAVSEGAVENIRFYPISESIIQNAAEQVIDVTAEGIRISVLANPSAPLSGTLEGVLAYDVSGEAEAIQFSAAGEQAAATPAITAPVSAPVAPAVTLGFAAALALAFAGGLLLNLMPCVLPIVALKAFAIAGKSTASRREIIWQGVSYTLGVLGAMVVLGGLLYTLKLAGEAVGWGFQLQSPYVVASLAVLMVLVAMHLFGWFHLPSLLTNTDQSLGNKKGLTGSFFTGALSVAVATPCTAPFMAPALGTAAIMPPLQGLLVLLALGLGLAFPYLLICIWPAARRILPKPGVWMERFKQFLAFPMLATSVWLVWVLAQLNGEAGIGILLAGLVLLAFGIWWLRGTHHLLRRVLAWGVIIAALWYGVGNQPPVQVNAASESDVMNGVTHVPYNAAKLAELRAAGTPVLVDATAAWCITCKINERVALRNAAVEAHFRAQGITLMVADWTMRDAAITEYLAGFGRNGVPLVVWYAPAKDPVILPQVLTPAIVLDALR